MNNSKHRFLTLLLAFVMLFTTLPLNVFAASGVNGDKKEITDIKTVGNKQVINLGNVTGEKPQLRFFSRGARPFGATTQRAGSSSETVAQKVEINLETLGLNLEEDQFDPSALTEVGAFDVEITFKELGGKRTEKRTMTFQAGETKKTETFYLPKDFGNGNVEAEIPKLKDNIALRVYVGGNSTTNFNLGQDMTYKFELSQIVHPVIDLKVVDPYGKELQENFDKELGLKLALADEHEFNLPANTKTFNIRTLSEFAGANIEDLNYAGENPTLSLTTALDANKKLKVGDKTYKLNKIAYNALGQEVEINGQTKKVGGYIEFATQPKIIVPTPDDEGNLPKTPDGYKRLSFHAETEANAQDGRFENGEKLKVIDVLEGTEYTDTDLQNQIKGIGQPTPFINGRKDDNKKFLKWKPELPTTGPVENADFRPVYLADGGEITPGEKLPKGVFEVKVIKDDTIAKDALYGKSYGVFEGSKLARDKFPDLVAADGHKDPKWTTEAEDPATGMEPIAKPWTKVITKATTFKATAGADAATQIGQNGLKAVDTIALQGQELTEEFWHKGVELADNIPADKKDAFAALLKEATVTDLSNRTSKKVEDQVGKLLVTFKDGSTLEVPNQKLIVKPNTVTVAFDKAEGKEHPLRDGDTTVKGKISASSNSDKFPVNLDGALVTIKRGNDVLSRTLANADGSFVAGVKDKLNAGEVISVVVTLPESKTESKPVTETVQLNPDKLNAIIPTGEAVVKNFDGKKGVDQEKVKTLKAAIKKAHDDLVEKDGKVKAGVKVDEKGQESLDNQFKAIKKAIEALTGNAAPEVTGKTSHKEIFKGDDLNLEEGITVTDADSTEQVSDIAQVNNKDFTYTVEKVDAKGKKTPVTDTATINQTAGTYEVTYTAKDKSGAEGTFVMTLVVKEPVVEIKDNFPEVIPDGYVKVEFKEGAHGTLEGTTKFLVKDGSAKTVLNAPTIKPNANYEAKKNANWDPAIPETFTGTEENNKSFTFTAQYTYIGKDVVEQKPGDKKPDVPSNFVKVEFKKGEHGVISSEETTIYWVNPDAGKKLENIKKPAVTAFEGYKFTGWDKADSTAIGADGLTVTAQYKAFVVEGEDQPTKPDPNDPGKTIPDTDYAKLTFKAGDNGEFVENAKTTIWVLKKEEVKFNAPQVKAKDGFVFNTWEPELKKSYEKDETHTAKYEPKSNISDVPVAGFQEVKFVSGKDGKFEGDKTEKSVWVRPNVQVDLTAKAPKVTVTNDKKGFVGWSQNLVAKFEKSDQATEITAVYKDKVVTKNPNDKENYAEVEFVAGDHGTFEKQGEKEQTTKFWVLKGEEVTFNEPQVTAKDGYTFKAWDPGVQKSYDKDQKHTATYTTNNSISDDPVEGFQEVKFLSGNDGNFGKTAKEPITEITEKSVWVEPGVLVDLRAKAPKVTANEGKTHIGWDKELVDKFEKSDQATEITAKYITDIDGNGIEDSKETTPTPSILSARNVKDTNAQDKIDTKVKVKALAGSTITIKDENGKVISDAVKVPADGDKKYNEVEITLTEKQDAGKKVQAIAKLGEMKDSEPAESIVFDDLNNDGKPDGQGEVDFNNIVDMRIASDPNTMKYALESEGASKDLDLSGLTVYVKDKNGNSGIYQYGAEANKVNGIQFEELKGNTNFKLELVDSEGKNPAAITDGTKLAKANDANKIKVSIAKDADKADTTGPLNVFVDANGNGVDDDKEKFNIKKATKVEIIKNPDKMDYLVNTPEGKAKFETKGLVVKFTDDSGKSATYTAEELAQMTDVTIKPANNEEIGLTPDGKTNKMDLTVTVTGAEATDKPTTKADKQVTVKLDADGNKIADEDEKSEQAKDVKALNQNKVDPETKKVTNQPKDTTTVTGKAKPGSTVIIKNEAGEQIGKVDKVGDDGDFTAEVTKQDEGKKVKVIVTEPGKQDSDPVETTVVRDSDNDGEDDTKAGQTERPAAIASNKGKTPAFTTIKGKTEKGAIITVTVKVEGKEKPVTVENLKVNDDGTYTLEAKYDNKPLENGAEIFVYAQNAPKTISKPQTTTVFNDFNNDGKPDGGKVDLTDVKDIQVIAPDKMAYTEGQKLVGTGLKAVVRDNKGGIEIFDYDNATGKFKDADGKEVADITATVADKAIKDLLLTEKDHDGKAIDVKAGKMTGSTNQKLEVKQLQTPTPTIEFAANQNTVGSDGSTPTGTAKQKTTVKFTVVNKPTTAYVKYTVNGEAKEESFEFGANDELTKTVDLAVKLPVGAEVKVLAKDADKTLSEAATAKVVRDANNDGTADDKTPVGKTAIDPIKAQSEKITVKPADNATELVIRETDKSGNTPKDSKAITVKKDKDGNWKIGDDIIKPDKDGKLIISTKDKLKLDEYNVVEVDAKGDPDTTTPSTAKEVVGEAADITAPAKPDVDQPVDGDKDIKVKTPTDKDAKTITVEVKVPAVPGEDPKTKTVVVTKDNDGKWKTPDGKDVPEENGKLVIPVDPAVKTGDTVTVEVKDESGNPSKSDPQTVVERKQLPQPTIDPIKTGGKTVSGTAKDAATVDIYKKNAQGKYDLIKGDVGVSADGSYTYNDKDGFKNGDVIRVVAKKPSMTSSNAEATVGVDTSALDKAITDGKGELDKRNEGTPADKALDQAIKEGEDLKKKDPAATQEEVNAAKDKIEKAIEEKKKTDEARDKLKEIIKEAEEETKKDGYKDKPGPDRRNLEKVIKEGKESLENNTKIPESTEKIEKALEKIRKGTVNVGLKDPRVNDQSITISTYPSYCTVKIFINDVFVEEVETDGFGTYRFTLDKPIESGTNIELKAHKDGYNDDVYWTKVN